MSITQNPPKTNTHAGNHPAADLFPMMDADAFHGLCEDIRKHGQLEPILLHDGLILDGRNRHAACVKLDLVPVLREWEPTGSPVEYVISKNLHRRHLTSSQRAMVAQASLPMLEAEAKKRQGTRTDINQEVDGSGQAADHAAKLTGTNRQYVSDAKRLAAERPDLAAKVTAGELSIPAAKEQARRDVQVIDTNTGEVLDDVEIVTTTAKRPSGQLAKNAAQPKRGLSTPDPITTLDIPHDPERAARLLLHAFPDEFIVALVANLTELGESL